METCIATVSKFSYNLIGINAVDILYKKQITSDVYINALRYPIFLKMKRTGDVKARGRGNGEPQQEMTSKE